MAELLVIPSELERAAGRLQASADQVRSVVGGLLPAVALGGGALGDAALFDGFHTMWSRWAAELGGPAGPHGVEPVEQGGVAQGGPAEGDGREQAADDRSDLVGAGLEPSGGSFQLAWDYQ